MDVLGIGANMVKAMRYWLQAVGLTKESDKGKRVQSFTELGKLIYKNDAYIEELGTLHLCSISLLLNRTLLQRGIFLQRIFYVGVLTRRFCCCITKYAKIRDGETEYAIRSLNDDFQCIINTYLPRYKSNPTRVSPENNIDCPFGELGLIDILNKRKRHIKRAFPQVILLIRMSSLLLLLIMLKGEKKLV